MATNRAVGDGSERSRTAQVCEQVHKSSASRKSSFTIEDASQTCEFDLLVGQVNRIGMDARKSNSQVKLAVPRVGHSRSS